MNADVKKAVQKSCADVQEAHPKERERFKSFLLANPNYFGNLAESSFKQVLPINGNTHYEELKCVGYHPQQKYLEGVVYIYQPSGYGTDICGPGTPEYVRFYLSYDNGGTWNDVGMTSFQAHNIPQGTEGGKYLEYAVSLQVDPKRKFCIHDPLIKARAILSWNNAPPPNQPNWIPIWGNRMTVTIQVEPFRKIFPLHFLKEAQIKLPIALEEALNFDQPALAKQLSLGAIELAEIYKDKGVPLHRFAFKELMHFSMAKTDLSAEMVGNLLPGISIDPSIFDLLFPKTDGDISFEELKCIGVDPNLPDTLVGVIQIKKNSGFSGGPCTNGSTEYVTFWGDTDNNGTFETCFGTAQVQAYDLSGIPAEGVYYAVRLPVNLSEYRQNCKKGPKLLRIRAILSWNAAVPCANPNQVPTWGNREETVINTSSVISQPAGKIAILGGIPVSFIDDISGLTTPLALFAANNLPPDSLGRPCPFGLRVTVQGAPISGYSYKVEVTPQGSAVPTPVLTDLLLTRSDGTTHWHTANPVTQRFTYQDFLQNSNSVLAQWDTSGDTRWTVKLSTFDAGGNLAGIDTHQIQLDNTSPDGSIEITSGLGDCGKFSVGDIISGNFVARDLYLGRYSLGVEPVVNPAGVGVPSPSSGLVNTAVSPGNPWSLDTTGMKPCGYVIRVVAVDRAILNSQSVRHWASDSSGLCLEEVMPK